MFKNIIKSALAASIAICAAPSQAKSQIVEMMPDYLLRRIAEDPFEQAADKLIAEAKISRGIVAGAKRWQPGSVVTVCFFGGGVSLRQKISAVAKQWETSGAAIKFDFGDSANPRICNGQFTQIRVGYSHKGYWSFVGQDSIIHVGQKDQSMNLERFEDAPPSDEEFRRVVLHEFGHALGFQHEHQHPFSSCQAEFKWDVVYKSLAEYPNSWSKRVVDDNMRNRPYHDGDVATEFNKQSIMLYTFPSEFYIGGESNKCYSQVNTTLSPGDLNTLRIAYPNPANASVSSPTGSAGAEPNAGVRPTATPSASAVLPSFSTSSIELQAASSGLNAAERAIIEERLALLRADMPIKELILGTVRPEYVDIDIFACNLTPQGNQSAAEATKVVSAQPRLGRVRLRDIAYPEGGLSRGVNIIADQGHPEYAEAERLVAAFNAVKPESARVIPNSGTPSRWLLSVAACE